MPPDKKTAMESVSNQLSSNQERRPITIFLALRNKTKINGNGMTTVFRSKKFANEAKTQKNIA